MVIGNRKVKQLVDIGGLIKEGNVVGAYDVA